jgi:hypothetical protein
VKQDAVKMKGLFTVCGGDRNDYVGSLFATSIRMIPYLTPAELDSIWNSMEAGPCSASLSTSVKELVSLLKATGRRDGTEMASRAKALLAGSGNMTTGTVKYLVATGMLGAISRGDKISASQLWSGYNTAIFGQSEPDLLFRLLAAESVEK